MSIAPAGPKTSPVWLWRRLLGLVVTLAVTLALTPLFMTVAFMFEVGLGDYDTSGEGGPLRSCADRTAISCSQPVWIAVVCIVAFVAFCVLAALAGVAAGAWGHKGQAAAVLFLVSAGLAWLISSSWPIFLSYLTHGP